jgi:hypothetical protein
MSPSFGVAPSATTTIENVERPLGHQDHVGAAGDAGVGGDPPGVAAHHLDDDHAVVRLGGGVQAVDRVGGDLHRGLEAEREVGPVEVVVDRLRHADDRDPLVDESPGDAQRVLAADRDQRAEPALAHRLAHLVDAALDLERVRARGAEDRAAAVQDAARGLVGELHRLVLEHARPAVPEPHELVLVDIDALADDAADDRVQAGAVAAPRE